MNTTAFATISRLRQQIECLNHHIAPDATKVKRLREKELKYLLGQQKKVKQEVERAYEQLDDRQAQLIDSIPGVGPLTTAATLIVVRDVSRFQTADSLKAYLGVYPRRNQSGKREGRSHLAHHGSKLMRHMLWNAAKAAVNLGVMLLFKPRRHHAKAQRRKGAEKRQEIKRKKSL